MSLEKTAPKAGGILVTVFGFQERFQSDDNMLKSEITKFLYN